MNLPVWSDYFLTDPYAIYLSAKIVFGAIAALLVLQAIISLPFYRAQSREEQEEEEELAARLAFSSERLNYYWNAKDAGHGTPEAKYWHDKAREVDAKEKAYLDSLR